MQLTLQAGDLLAHKAALIVLGGWEGEALPAAVAELIAAEDWAGKPQQQALLYSRGALPATRLLLVGLGKRADASLERVRSAAALAAQKARELKLTAYSIAALGADALDPAQAAQALAEGTLLGAYRFLAFKSNSDEERVEIEQVTLVAPETEALEAGLRVGVAVAEATNMARDLANGPGNSVIPAVLGEKAQELAQRYGMQATVLGPSELAEQGFHAILAVGQGSVVEPRFIVLEYGQAAADKPTICLVGKGITFDTGGISIKPAGGMEDMKYDMGGAAAVLGAMQAVGELQLPLHVVGLVAAAENMPSASAYKPGDVIRTLSGKTIEVLNTDAEGRIVLADALFFAQRYQPAAVVDLATLTGACVVALGNVTSGMMSNNQQLADKLSQAGQASGERVWQLPLWEEYRDQMKSTVADVKNAAGREGGALTAAGFLWNFVGDYPWAHLDIAGTAWTGAKPKPYQPKGATGYGVRLLVELLRSWQA